MFCRCPNRFGAAPNTLVCPVCLGYPGTLPVPNRHAVDLAVRLALALGFDGPRDLGLRAQELLLSGPPQGLSDQPVRPPAGRGRPGCRWRSTTRQVRVERLHLEEDAGKLLHEAPGGGALPGQSLVDFNRCGVPLVEIVSRPDMASAAEAQDYLQTLHQLLLYTRTSDGNMEEGSLRCDANVSVRRRGETRARHQGRGQEPQLLPQRRARHRARDRAPDRRCSSPAAGWRRRPGASTPAPASRGCCAARRRRTTTATFPEPDLPPLVVDRGADRARSAAALPELPWQRRARLRRAVRPAGRRRPGAHRRARARRLLRGRRRGAAGESQGDRQLGAGRGAARRQGAQGGARRDARRPSASPPWSAMVDAGKISNSAAKEVFAAMAPTGEEPAAAVERLGLAQVSRQLADRALDRRGDRSRTPPRWRSTAPARSRSSASWWARS